MHTKRLFGIMALSLGLALALLAGLHTARAAPMGGGGLDWYVSASGNNTTCDSWATACHTISEAYNKAVSGDRIHVAAGTYNEHLFINKSLSITGTHPDRGLVTIVNGSAPGAVFTVNSPQTVTLAGMTIHNSQPTSYGGGISNHGTLRLEDVLISNVSNTEYGGGLFNDGTATLNDVTISHNTAMTYAGGIYNQAGGVLTLTQVTVHGNTATGGPGGGVLNFGSVIMSDVVISGNVAGGAGGGFYTQGSANITRVTLDGNKSNSYGGGIANGDGSLTLLDVTLYSNTAPSGGGIWNYQGTKPTEATLDSVTLYSNTATIDRGGGIWNQNGTMYLINVTFSGNTAQLDGGGIYNQSGTLDVTNATIAYNTVVTSTAAMAGGIANLSGSANVENTIIAFNDNRNCSGVISPVYNRNLDSNGDNTCQVDDDLVGYDPLLGPLRDNGGETWTHALLADSWAIDNGANAVCPSTDQRGFHRPIIGTPTTVAVCDIGAFEYGPQVFLPLVLQN
jgi:predicted outer membrane repeat protein